jgi:hypothetical protein
VAELGETQDPQALVPGKPEATEENARVLHARADRANQAGEGLEEIDTGGWDGPAARAFRDKFSYEPGKWFAVSDALESAASVLEDYASTLRWAQAQATEAIELWNRGQAATEQAKAQHDQAAAQAAAQNQPPPPFSDPGEGTRQAARDTLNRARTQLAEAGDAAATALREGAERAPQDSSWLDDVGNFLGDVGAHIVNDVASFGNAMLNHPDKVAEALLGLGGTVLSSAGFVAGTALDATGVGAIGGVALQGVSATGLVASGALAETAMASIIQHAAGDDHIEVVKNESGSGESTTSGANRSGEPVRREDLTSDQQANLKRYEKKLPAGAEETQITRLEDGSLQFESRVPGRVPGSSATYTKVVAEDGTTVGYTKTTTLPDGSIAHVKDKMPK